MAIALGVLVGLVLGLTGAGGGILAVPMLMAGVGWTLPQAAPVALIAVCLAASLGTYLAWRQGWVRYRAALLMGAMGAATAPLGILLAGHLSLPVLSLIFATALLIAAVRLWRQSLTSFTGEASPNSALLEDGRYTHAAIIQLNPDTGRILWTYPTTAIVAGIGAFTGVVAGLLGVGGGFIIVPALRWVTPLPMHSAVATSLMVIALISGSTVVGALISGYSYPWVFAAPFAAGAMTGMLAGRAIAPRIAGPRLQQGFAALMVLAAVVLAIRTSS